MKALIIADDEKAIERFSAVLKSAGYDIIVYRWLIKALDNIEEIAPHLILVSAVEYPRHWKTLASYAESGIGGIVPQIILYTGKDFSDEEKSKAEKLGIRGFFSSCDVDGLDELRKILSKNSDIFMGELEENKETERIEIKNKDVSFIFVNPENEQLITGNVIAYVDNIIDFSPDFTEDIVKPGTEISNAMLKISSSVRNVKALVLHSDSGSMENLIKIKILAE